MDLESRFVAAGVPRSAYSIGADDNEAYCLIEDRDGWQVYYSERGRRNNERVFEQEASAVAEMWRIVTNDAVVKEVLRGRAIAGGSPDVGGDAPSDLS